MLRRLRMGHAMQCLEDDARDREQHRCVKLDREFNQVIFPARKR